MTEKDNSSDSDSSSDEQVEEPIENLSSSSDDEDEDPTDRSFGEQFALLLNAEVPEGKCPILCFSKVPGKIDRLKHEKEQKEKEEIRIKIAKKTLMNTKHVDPSLWDDDEEKRLKKKALNGVLALFNANSTAQTNPEILKPVKEEEAPKKKEEFLGLLLQAASKK